MSIGESSGGLRKYWSSIAAVTVAAAIYAGSLDTPGAPPVASSTPSAVDAATDSLLIAMQKSQDAREVRDFVEFCELLSATRCFLESFALAQDQSGRYPELRDSAHVMISHLAKAERDSFVAYKMGSFNSYHMTQTYKKLSGAANDVHPDLKSLVDAMSLLRIDDLFSRENQVQLSQLIGDDVLIRAAFLDKDLGAEIGALRAVSFAKDLSFSVLNKGDPMLEGLLDIRAAYHADIVDPAVSLDKALLKAHKRWSDFKAESVEPVSDVVLEL